MNGGSTIRSGSSGDDVLEMAVDSDRLPCPTRARVTDQQHS